MRAGSRSCFAAIASRSATALESGYRWIDAAAATHAARAAALQPSAFSFAESLMGAVNPAALALPGTYGLMSRIVALGAGPLTAWRPCGAPARHRRPSAKARARAAARQGDRASPPPLHEGSHPSPRRRRERIRRPLLPPSA